MFFPLRGFVMSFAHVRAGRTVTSLLMGEEAGVHADHLHRFSRLASKNSVRIGLGIVVAVGAVALVSALTGGKVTSGQSRIQAGYTGVKVPDFALSAVRGGVVREPWLDHKPAVVFFFASWCPPCQGEMPKLAKFLNTHHLGDGRVSVFGVDGDNSKADALRFMDKDRVDFPVGFNPSDSVIQGDFRINFFPDTEYVSAKGVIKHVHFGAITAAELTQGVKVWLGATTKSDV
jgi:thiol-disulfide isomerase/thioredoxin